MANLTEELENAGEKTKRMIEHNKEVETLQSETGAPVSAADVTANIGEQVNVPGTEMSDVQNLATGEYIPANSPYLEKFRRANEAINRLGEHFDGTQYNFQDFREKAGEDYSVVNEMYGNVPYIKRGWDNPGLMTTATELYGKSKAKADADAAAAAKAEADKDVTITRGDRSYTMTKQNADEMKELIGMYAGTNSPEAQKQIIASLVDKFKQAGFDIAIDPANPPKTFEDLENIVLSSENGLDMYRDMNAIMEEASRDRTPKEPEKKSIQDLWYERQARQYEIDRDKEARRLRMEELGHGIAGISEMIGDMVRASEGARVDPREWQKIYDNLTAQERANVNNYQVRMAKLNEDRRQERMLAAKQAADAAKAAQGYQQALQLAGIKEGGANKRAAAKIQADKDIAAANNATKKAIADAKLAANRNKGSKTNIRAFGEVYHIPSSENTNTLTAIAGMLEDFGQSLGILNDVLGTDKEVEARTRTLMLLQKLGRPDVWGNYVVELPAGDNGKSKEVKVTLTKAQADEIKSYLKQVMVKDAEEEEEDDETEEYVSQSSQNTGFDPSNVTSWFQPQQE